MWKVGHHKIRRTVADYLTAPIIKADVKGTDGKAGRHLISARDAKTPGVLSKNLKRAILTA